MTKRVEKVSYGYLMQLFVRVGSIAFGGWSTTALLLEDELVTKRGLLTLTEIQGPVAYAQIIPGGTQTAIVSGVGYKLRGLKGSIVATFFYLLPSMSLILLFSVIYFQYLRDTELTSHLNLIRAALGGIILSNAYKLGKRHSPYAWLWLFIGVAFLAKLLLGLNSALIIVGYAVCGIGVSIIRLRKQEP